MPNATVDLYAEELVTHGSPVAEFCEVCVECEGSEFCEPCENCACDTGSCDCFSIFCDSCIA
jgi:hypothetical protein